jgi:hypothetical protein
MDTAYVWQIDLEGERFIILALGDSPEAGISRILGKFSKSGMCSERLLLSEQALRNSSPQIMDFADEVGMISFHAH